MMQDMFNIKKNIITGLIWFALFGAYAWLSKPNVVEATSEDVRPVERLAA